jgi:diguanylate cyclase (GGDEF)-like protein
VPVTETFCRYTIAGDGPMVVPDATLDARFKDNPHVTGSPHVRFYAGVPLKTSDGHNIGTICAFGSEPRTFSERDTQILSELGRMAMHELELRQVANTDVLTGILSRRAFKEDAGKFIALSRRHRTSVSCVTFDIDHFKRVNDTYGHSAGDKVLQEVTRACRSQLRESDLIGRLGGEEFAVLLPDADLRQARDAAEKLRLVVRGLDFPGSRPPITVSASFGIAAFDPDRDDIDSLLVKADEALYEAKRNGRNRSETWQGTTTATTRAITRRRVLKSARIVFNNRRSTINCTVRSIWETGAELLISDSASLPDTFTVILSGDGTEWDCRITDRRSQHVEVEFVTKP